MLELIIGRAILHLVILGNVPRYVASQLGVNVVFEAISHSGCLVNIPVVAPVLFLVMIQIFSSENLVVNEVSVLGVTLSNLMSFNKGFNNQSVIYLSVIVPGIVYGSRCHRFLSMEEERSGLRHRQICKCHLLV